MAVLLDTGILYAYYDRSDSWHEPSVDLLRGEKELIVPAPVIPKVDYLLGQRLGPRAQSLFYQGLVDEHFLVTDLHPEGYRCVQELNRKFADLKLGFVDAAVVAVAEALEVFRIATSDRIHFSPLAAAFGFELLPEVGPRR